MSGKSHHKYFCTDSCMHLVFWCFDYKNNTSTCTIKCLLQSWSLVSYFLHSVLILSFFYWIKKIFFVPNFSHDYCRCGRHHVNSVINRYNGEKKQRAMIQSLFCYLQAGKKFKRCLKEESSVCSLNRLSSVTTHFSVLFFTDTQTSEQNPIKRQND